MSRSTMARAASSAIPRTFDMADCFGGGDGFFGVRELCVERILKRLAAFFGFRRLLLARFVRDCLRPRTRISQRFFVGRNRCVRFAFQPGGLGDIVSDVLLAASMIEPMRGNASFAIST